MATARATTSTARTSTPVTCRSATRDATVSPTARGTRVAASAAMSASSRRPRARKRRPALNGSSTRRATPLSESFSGQHRLSIWRTATAVRWLTSSGTMKVVPLGRRTHALQRAQKTKTARALSSTAVAARSATSVTLASTTSPWTGGCSRCSASACRALAPSRAGATFTLRRSLASAAGAVTVHARRERPTLSATTTTTAPLSRVRAASPPRCTRVTTQTGC
mmetsp:Transcript_18905/g.43413  ORF Transcript_18905/g.43413 Transcript_18905/m.43413 type:complete len:223 (+) Transcript_18905:3500-4168(+)